MMTTLDPPVMCHRQAQINQNTTFYHYGEQTKIFKNATEGSLSPKCLYFTQLKWKSSSKSVYVAFNKINLKWMKRQILNTIHFYDTEIEMSK